MKTRTFVSILILVLAVLIIAGSWAIGQDVVKAPKEPLYGTWVNPDYNIDVRYAKITLGPSGTYIDSGHTDITEGRKGTYLIIDSWIDSDGNKYYKAEVLSGPIGKEEFHELWRLNETDTVWELIWSEAEYPTEIDPEHARYLIYYRQE